MKQSKIKDFWCFYTKLSKKAQAETWGFVIKAALVILGLLVAVYLLYWAAVRLGVI